MVAMQHHWHHNSLAFDLTGDRVKGQRFQLDMTLNSGFGSRFAGTAYQRNTVAPCMDMLRMAIYEGFPLSHMSFTAS